MVASAERLRALRTEVLEGIASGAGLVAVATALCLHVERLAPDAICTILKVDDGRHLRTLAAPHLPEAFSTSIDGVPIGPDVGSCGTAAFLGRSVATIDIGTDPRWDGYRDIPLAAGLRACWSTPMRGRDGTVVGSFAFYYRTCRGPTALERRIVATSVSVCAMAIEHEAVQSRLAQANERFDVALTHLSQGVCFFDGEQRLIVANRRYAEIYGLTLDSIPPGTTLRQIVQLRIAAGSGPRIAPEAYFEWRDTLRGTPTPTDTEVELINGRIIAIHHQPMPDRGWVATHEDISARRRAEAQIAHMARHDALTGLPTRALFQERLEQAMGLCARGQQAALLCIDLDHFKAINDTFGHPCGDLLLQETANRLQACVREVDTVTRLGGDEFAILLVGLDRPDGARDVGQRVVRMLSERVDLDGHGVAVSASVGIAIAPDDGATPAKLLRSADTALYRAKLEGRGSFRFFEPAMDAMLQERLNLERDLRHAVDVGEFELQYQPVFTAATQRLCGFEALLRWPHPVRGSVPPAAFIPLAEELGLLVPLGAWVLRTACQEAAQWPDEVQLSVNLSAGQFRDSGLAAQVALALRESGLRPARLELELTETVLLRQSDDIASTLEALHELGVRLTLDDFGAGASSLRFLRTLPFAKVKIDRASLIELANAAPVDGVLRAIVGLARSFGMTAAAEGIETTDELEQVQREGCTEIQGYLTGRPASAAAARALAEEGQADAHPTPERRAGQAATRSSRR